MSELKKRLKKLDALEGKVSSVLLFNHDTNPNFFYFTNSNVIGVFYYDFNKPRLFTNEMEFSRAKKSWIRNVEVIKIEQIYEKIKGKIGIDKKKISASVYEKIKAKKVDVSDFLENMRSIKTNYEKKCIAKACRISAVIYEKIENEWKGLTEIELKGLIEFLMHKNSVTPAFPTIVASGNNVVYPHHESGKKKLSLPVLIDFGVRYNGYCSDITRTIGSDFDDVIEKVFVAVEEELKPGKKAAELDKKARAIMGRYSKYFIHGLGHGVGLEVHEKPVISQRSKDVLKPNMTFTIEPGIYRRSGIRHEEDYLLTENGAIKLT